MYGGEPICKGSGRGGGFSRVGPVGPGKVSREYSLFGGG